MSYLAKEKVKQSSIKSALNHLQIYRGCQDLFRDTLLQLEYVDALKNYILGRIKKTDMLFILQNRKIMTKQWLMERLD